MRKVLMVLLLLAALPCAAVQIPSSIAGDYVGGGFACRVLPTIMPGAQQRGVVWACTAPDGGQLSGASWGPDCPGDYSVFALARWGSWPDGYVYTRIVSLGPDAVTVRVGTDAATMYAGGGALLTLTRVQPQTSPAPYAGCTGATLDRKR